MSHQLSGLILNLPLNILTPSWQVSSDHQPNSVQKQRALHFGMQGAFADTKMDTLN